MKRNLTSFAAAGALLVAGAGLSAAQAQVYYGDYAPAYVAYDYGWGPGPVGALIAAPVVAAAGVVGAAADQTCNAAGGFTFSWAATAALNAAGTPLQLAAAAASGAMRHMRTEPSSDADASSDPDYYSSYYYY
jgi:hypothetical protein